MDPSPVSFRHTPIEDAQGLAFGIVMTSFAVLLLKSAGLVTGQLAGLSVLLSYVTGWDFGLIYLVLNLPFLTLAWVRRGKKFTLLTLVAIAGLWGVTRALPETMTISAINPWVAALLAGCTAGVGLIALFRHGASAGGLGIVALIVQEKTGFRAGWFQMGFDGLVFLAAFLVLAPSAVLISLFGAFVLNAIIALNYRPERYPVSL